MRLILLTIRILLGASVLIILTNQPKFNVSESISAVLIFLHHIYYVVIQMINFKLVYSLE